MIPRPLPEEYPGFEPTYVSLVPEGADVLHLLRSQPDRLRAMLQNTWDSEASKRPRHDEWSVKEVIGHIADTERIYAYRCLRIARGDTTPLPGFDQEVYVSGTDLNARSLEGLMEEFELQRRANVLCFEALDDFELARSGTVNDLPVSARAMLYVMAGHVMHHLESLATDYKLVG